MARKLKTPAPVDRGQLRLDARFREAGDKARFEGKHESEVFEALLSRAMCQPEIRSASVIQRLDESTDLNFVADELRIQAAAVRGGDMGRAESMLIAQAHSLDALFANLARRACGNMGGGHLEATEIYFKLALRAQNQCRATLETLSAIKNPPVVYAKQVNMAHQQQVINGATPQPVAKDVSHTPGSGITQNELLEAHDVQRLDTRTPEAAIGANTRMEAVGAIKRAKD